MNVDLHKQLLEKELTIRHLLTRMHELNKKLKHSLDCKDNMSKQIIYTVSKSFDRIDKQMFEEYGKYDASLSDFKRGLVEEVLGICEKCGAEMPADGDKEYCDRCQVDGKVKVI